MSSSAPTPSPSTTSSGPARVPGWWWSAPAAWSPPRPDSPVAPPLRHARIRQGPFSSPKDCSSPNDRRASRLWSSGLALWSLLIPCHTSETAVLPFSGWVLDLAQRTAEGQVFVILSSDEGEFPFEASRRH